MPNSHRIRTQLGVDKVLQINLDQDYDTLELLSFSFFPNDVYTRSCADFGVVCGRVFCNRGLGLVNARVSIFIPISSEDESNPIISTLYPYKSFIDFNEDGYKYNLLPYSPSHSGHVPVGTFPDRLDALTNQTVVEVYDKYYKFTAKTNDAGDFMIFGVPVGQYDLFMQVDLSDIGEFSLTPQDLIRMGRATEAQVAGTKFKFSENYSELPQIITLTKVIQIAPFYGQDGICQHYITRADFDLTTEASIELQPTSIFMGSVISAENRKKLKRSCKVPAKQGWLCNLITGPGQIETIRHTINTDIDGRPILEQYRLQNDGKLIDENGTWVIELPMNLDYVYTDEFGNRRISPDGSVGVPIRGRYRFRIKWQQSPNLSDENKRGYFLVPNIKEHGWPLDARTDTGDPGLAENVGAFNLNLPTFPPLSPDDPPSSGPFDVEINSVLDIGYYYNVQNTNNIQSYVILVDGIERPDLNDTIPMGGLAGSVVGVRYTLIDPALEGTLTLEILDGGQFRVQSSYAFSRSWADYGTAEMIQEAINCEDRFYEFQYNKVYTVSQLIDRYSNRIFPQKSIQIKHILDDKCEGDYNPFPTNDAYYRYDLLYITVNVILTIMKFQFFQILIFLHVLAFLWPVIALLLVLVWGIQQLVYLICLGLQKFGWRDRECNEPRPLREMIKNPFKNLNLPLFLYTEDGCERCRCKVDPQDLDEENNEIAFDLLENLDQIEETNISYLANFATLAAYQPWNNNLTNSTFDPYYLTQNDNYNEAVSVMLAGNAASAIGYRRMPIYAGNLGDGRNYRVFSTSLTIAERLNLFNTKAKYFDNLTANAEGDNDLNRRENSLSPGNTGWNQIKVTWNTIDNNPTDKYHFDNVIVLILDNYIQPGTVLTFQDPSMSNDPHVLTTTGTCLNPSYVVVNYANPNTDFTSSPILSTIYDIDLARYPVVSTPTPGGEARLGTVTRKQVCFPMDIEYFQVLQEMSYSDYYFYTNSAAIASPAFNTDDARFSLPWRILRNAAGNTPVTEASLKFYSNYAEAEAGQPQNVRFGNGQWVYRHIDQISSNLICFDACYNVTTHVTNNLNSIRSYFPYSESTPEFNTLQRPDPNLRVAFLQRGVDVNAPRLRNRYDLRRLFGVRGDWNEIPRINHVDPNVGGQFDISDACIVQGNYFPNIPIQPGGASTLGYNQNNSSGWLMSGVIQSYNLQGRPIVNPEYQFLAVLESNFIQTGGIMTLGPLSESTESFVDDNDVFDGGVLTAPTSDEYYFTVFLRYSGLVNNANGLAIIIRNITTNAIEWTSEFIQVSTSTLNHTEDVIVPLVQGNQYRLEVRNFTFNDITFYFDEPSWLIMNPNGLKLPKHNEFTSNSPNLINSNNSNIFFSSPFFRISENSFTAFTSTMANYYSALDENALYDSFGPNAWRTQFQSNLENGGVRYNGQFGTLVISNSEGINSSVNDNGFSKTLAIMNYNGMFRIPCAVSDIVNDPWRACGNEPDLGIRVDVDNPCGTCGTTNNSNNEGDPQQCPGCCRDREELRRRLYMYHATLKSSFLNEVGSYWGKEYVEGGSAFSLKLSTSSDRFQAIYSDSVNCQYEGGGSPSWANGGGRCYNCEGDDSGGRSIIFNDVEQQYISPCYATFPNVDPSPSYVEFFGSVEDARPTWYVNPNHEININYRAMNVFRTDRLPSSTTPQQDGNGNGYLLHQNNGFSMFVIDIDGCSVEQAGGGELPTPPQISDVSYENLPDGLSTVASSLSNCALAVDLNSYYVESDGNPAIDEGGNGYSSEPAAIGADWVWFKRGYGCYNLVSKPLASLFPHRIDGDPDGKWYWDVATVVEWIQRLKLTFAQCFEIFSHTFSNNWINGTLYAFPFQNATRFDSQNQPYRLFCKDVVYFHDPVNTYYYRSSPWNGSNFVGKYRDEGDRGNLRNLQTPTTILDMGPKAAFIQEIVLSDDYDGYIVSRVPSSSFQNVTDILNLFILNRLVNTNFIQQLIPLPADEAGNEEGSDDPSVGAMFANTRWKNGDAFFANLLPGLIDADYSQLISINSEFGVGEYSPETYTNNDVFFGEDEGRGSILGFLGREYSTKRPVLGIYFSGDNQLRDYISPRRTIWNQNALIPVQDADFTDITTKTQIVPFYQWNIFHDRADPDEGPSIFGTQSNNFITDLNKDGNYYTNSSSFPDGFFAHGYQSLDRFGNSSEYFNPDGNNTFTYKGYIINYNEQVDDSGNVTGYTPTFNAQTTPRYRYTFGAPFHFYFGLKQGSSAMDRFISIYVDTTVIYE